MFKSRMVSFLAILLIYILAFSAAYACYVFVSGVLLWRMLLADVVATVVVWIFGMICKNSSVYDPYWSVAPLVIIPAWLAIRGGAAACTDIFLVVAVYIWGIRLTLNWAIGFMGLNHQDWRYTMYRQQNPKTWFWINLTGINVMPTILVLGGMIPAYLIIMNPMQPSAISLIGFVICLLSAGTQFIADNQLFYFKKRNLNNDLCIEEGLWKYSRHPNYFGEIAFWWGIYIMQFGILPQYWYTIFAPAAITLLFIFISIPMMEKHVEEKRPQYDAYKNRVSMLIPLKRKA